MSDKKQSSNSAAKDNQQVRSQQRSHDVVNHAASDTGKLMTDVGSETGGSAPESFVSGWKNDAERPSPSLRSGSGSTDASKSDAAPSASHFSTDAPSPSLGADVKNKANLADSRNNADNSGGGNTKQSLSDPVQRTNLSAKEEDKVSLSKALVQTTPPEKAGRQGQHRGVASDLSPPHRDPTSLLVPGQATRADPGRHKRLSDASLKQDANATHTTSTTSSGTRKLSADFRLQQRASEEATHDLAKYFTDSLAPYYSGDENHDNDDDNSHHHRHRHRPLRSASSYNYYSDDAEEDDFATTATRSRPSFSSSLTHTHTRSPSLSPPPGGAGSPVQVDGESYLFTDPRVAAQLLNPPAGARKRSDAMDKWYDTVEDLMALSKKTMWTVLRPPPVEEPWNINDKTANSRERMAKYRFFASARLRYKARTMIGATGSRHLGHRRRASLASGGMGLPSNMLSHLQGVAEDEEGRGRARGAVNRRRVVDTSDLRTCAILQTRLKEIKTYPE